MVLDTITHRGALWGEEERGKRYEKKCYAPGAGHLKKGAKDPQGPRRREWEGRPFRE